MKTFLEDAAQFATTCGFEDLPPDVVEACKQAFIDCIGVTLAGVDAPAVQAASRYALAQASKPEARLLCGGIVSAELAAFVNGVCSHVADFDDVSWVTIGHPSVVLVPVCLALAQKNGSSGADMIHAYALGFEVMHALAKTTMPQLSEHGWHTTSVYGALGATVSAAVLSKLTESELREALGIAVSLAAGVRANFGSHTKSFHAGAACRAGVFATELARNGMSSSADAFEGIEGFAHCFTGRKPSQSTLHLGISWDIVTSGIVFKKYPCCSGAAPAIDLTLEMMSTHGFVVEDIERVRVGCSLLAPKELRCNHPKTALEAKFSMQFAIAAALTFGKVTFDEFVNEVVARPDIQQLMTCIEMNIDEEFAQFGFIGTSPARLRFELRDGRVFDGVNMLARGNPDKPLTSTELREKFLRCARNIKDPMGLYDDLMCLEKIGGVNELFYHFWEWSRVPSYV